MPEGNERERGVDEQAGDDVEVADPPRLTGGTNVSPDLPPVASNEAPGAATSATFGGPIELWYFR